MEGLTEYGPVWALVGILLAFNVKLVFVVIKVVENNTAALQKHSDVILSCTKNKG